MLKYCLLHKPWLSPKLRTFAVLSAVPGGNSTWGMHSKHCNMTESHSAAAIPSLSFPAGRSFTIAPDDGCGVDVQGAYCDVAGLQQLTMTFECITKKSFRPSCGPSQYFPQYPAETQLGMCSEHCNMTESPSAAAAIPGLSFLPGRSISTAPDDGCGVDVQGAYSGVAGLQQPTMPFECIAPKAGQAPPSTFDELQDKANVVAPCALKSFLPSACPTFSGIFTKYSRSAC